MSRSRPVTDFPRNEPGLVDKFIGTAYDVVKEVYLNLEEIDKVTKELDTISSVHSEIPKLNKLISLLQSNKIVVVINKKEDLEKIDTNYFNSARVIQTLPDGSFGFDEYLFNSPTNKWVHISTSFDENMRISFVFNYKEGNADGGEIDISLPKGTEFITSVFLNGIREIPENMGTFNKLLNKFTLYKPLVRKDELVFTYSDNEYSFVDFIKTQEMANEAIDTSNVALQKINDLDVKKEELLNGGSIINVKNIHDIPVGTNGVISDTTTLNSPFKGKQYVEVRSAGIDGKLIKVQSLVDGNTAVSSGSEFVIFSSKKELEDKLSNSDLTDSWTLENRAVTTDFIKSSLNYFTPEMFGATGDGVTNDNAAVVEAVNAATNNNSQVLISGKYRVNDSFNPIRSVFKGEGAITFSNGNEWWVTNRGTHENIIYVSGTAINSGMTKSTPTTLRNAIDKIKGLGGVLDGYYVIEFLEGVHTYNGIRLYDMPVFVRYLKIRGQKVAMNTEPTSIWDGAYSSEPYAFLGQNPQSFPYRIEVEDLYVRNWYKDKKPNSGFMVLWQEATVYSKNIWYDNVSFGISVRQGYYQALGGKAFNSRSPYGVSYNAVGKIGSLNKEHAITIKNCDYGVEIGRNSVCYIQNVTFDECGIDISASRLSRFRSQACTHKNWERACYSVSLGSVHTPDNNAGYPDKFIHHDPNREVLRMMGNSTHMHIQRLNDNNIISFNTVEFPSGILEKELITSHVPVKESASSFSPFRIPAYTLLTKGSYINIEFVLGNRGSSGELSVHGKGDSNYSLLGTISIKNERTTHRCRITIKNNGNNQLYSSITIGSRTTYRTVNINTPIAEQSEDWLIGRIYLTSVENKDLPIAYTISDMQTNIGM